METIQDGNELVFLYQLIPGHSDTSHACHIATLAGLPKEVVERGAQVSTQHQCVCVPGSHRVIGDRFDPTARTNSAAKHSQYGATDEDVSIIYTHNSGHVDGIYLPPSLHQIGLYIGMTLCTVVEPIHTLKSCTLRVLCRCEKIVSRFLELDLENDDLEAFLKDFVYPTGKDIL